MLLTDIDTIQCQIYYTFDSRLLDETIAISYGINSKISQYKNEKFQEIQNEKQHKDTFLFLLSFSGEKQLFADFGEINSN